MKNKSIQPTFVDKSRMLLVDGLEAILDQINQSGKTRWISLESPSGWGKTRVVQEFYNRLASKPEEQYWPSSIFDTFDADNLDVSIRSKRIYPSPSAFQRKPLSLPRFMWLGIACNNRNGLPSDVLLEDLRQFEIHATYLEAAWSAIEKFKVRTSKSWSLSDFRKGVFALLEEGVNVGATEIIEEITKTVIPGIGLVTKLTRLGFSRVSMTRKRNKLISSTGQLAEVNCDELINNSIEIVSKLAIKGLPLIVFVEDFHRANGQVIEFLTRLIRLDSAVMIVSSTWPREFERYTKITEALADPAISSRFIRVDTDECSIKELPEGASLRALSVESLKEIVLWYFPKIEMTTLELLTFRYNNPLALELVCSLQIGLSDSNEGELELSKDEVESLPWEVEAIYRELWKALPVEIQRALALATLSIPKNHHAWHYSLTQRAIQQYLINVNTQNDFNIQIDFNTPYGWTHTVELWLRRFNDPVQLHVARAEISSLFRNENIKLYLNELSNLLKGGRYDSGEEEKIYCAWLTMSLQKYGNIYEEDLAKAIVYLQEILAKDQREIGTMVELGKRLLKLEVDPQSIELLRGRFLYGQSLLNNEQPEEALKVLKELLHNLIASSGNMSEESLETRIEIELCSRALEKPSSDLFSSMASIVDETLETFGQKNRVTMRAVGEFARLFLGNTTGAEDISTGFGLLRQVIKQQIETLGPEDIETIQSRMDLAFYYGVHHLTHDALEEYSALIADLENWQGDNDPDILRVRMAKAYVYGTIGSEDLAYEYYEALIRDWAITFGESDSKIFVIRLNFGVLLARRVIFEGVEYLRKLVADQTRILGARSRDFTYLQSRMSLASWLAKSGKKEEALEYYEELAKITDLDSERSYRIRESKIRLLNETNRYSEALVEAQFLYTDYHLKYGNRDARVEGLLALIKILGDHINQQH